MPIVVFAFAALLTGVSVAARQAGAVVSTRPGPPPPSIEEWYRRAGAIISGEVVSSGRAFVDQFAPGGSRYVIREHRVRVDEAFKGLAKPGDEIVLIQSGGTAEFKGELYRTAYGSLPLLEPGNRGLMFLSATSRGRWSVSYGENGFFWYVGPDRTRLAVPAGVRHLPPFDKATQIGAARLIDILRVLRERGGA
jgi:hypothetical protein